MEVDAPVPPPADAPAVPPPPPPPPPPPSSIPLTEHLANALSQHDYALALRVANELEIVIQVRAGTVRKRREREASLGGGGKALSKGQ